MEHAPAKGLNPDHDDANAAIRVDGAYRDHRLYSVAAGTASG